MRCVAVQHCNALQHTYLHLAFEENLLVRYAMCRSTVVLCVLKEEGDVGKGGGEGERGRDRERERG